MVHDGLTMGGYWWPPARPEWKPDSSLVDFLAAGPPPVYVGFGSGAQLDADLALEAVRLAGVRAVTVHSLLGSKMPRTSVRFKHDRHHRLPCDVVVVDEASMLSLSMAAVADRATATGQAAA